MSGEAPVLRDPFADEIEALAGQRSDPFAQDVDWLAQQRMDRAEGLLNRAGIHALNIARVAGDGMAHLASLAYRSARSGTGALVSAVEGDGLDFSRGWQEGEDELKAAFGSPDPSSLDVIYGAQQRLGGEQSFGTALQPPRGSGGMTVGQLGEDYIQRKLGNSRAISEAAGYLLSFATGPGAAIGRTGAEIVQPLAGLAERAIGRMVTKGAIEKKVADDLMAKGQLWETIAKDPALKRSVGWFGQLVGKNARELVGLTAANVAQSYGLAPDSERNYGAMLALLTSPLIQPIATAGRALAGRALAGGMGEATTREARDILRRAQSGDLTIPDADRALRQLAGPTRVAMANLMGSAVEGSLFQTMDPQAYRDLADWYGGDAEAGERLMGRWMGSVGGLLVLKHAIPHDLVPMFRQVRPDLNRLETWLDAEATRRAIEATPEEPQALTPQDPVAPPRDRAQEGEARFGGHRMTEQQEAGLGSRYGPELLEQQQVVHDEYGWAAQPVSAAMRSGFMPELAPDGAVDLRFDHEHKVQVSQQGDTLALGLTRKIVDLLGQAGRPVEGIEVQATGQVTGEQAKHVLDDVSLLGLSQRLHGDVTYARIGFQEVGGGLWREIPTGMYWRMGLDGISQQSALPNGEIVGKQDIGVTAGYGEPQYQSRGLDQFIQAVIAKQALAPDPLVDQVLTQVALVAQFGEGNGAQQVREFFDTQAPESWTKLLRESGHDDDWLAFQLGSLATAQTNAPTMVRELATAATQDTDSQMPEGDAPPTRAPWRTPGDRPIEEGWRGNLADEILASEAEQAARVSLPDRLGPEAGVGLVPGRRELEAARETLFDPLARAAEDYAETLPNVVRRAGAREFAEKAEEVQSLTRTNRGEVARVREQTDPALQRVGESRLSRLSNLESDPEGWQRGRFRTLVEGRAAAESPAEASAVQGARDVLRTTWGQLQRSGAMRERTVEQVVEGKLVRKQVAEPLRDSDGSVLPRVRGADWQDLIQGPVEVRDRFFDQVLARNPDLKLAREQLADAIDPKPREGKVTTSLRESAAEFYRTIREMPDVWTDKVTGRRYELHELSPSDILAQVERSQTARAATVQVFGPDLSAEAREGAGIQKKGISEAAREAKAQVRAGRGKARMERRIDRLALALQGDPGPIAERLRGLEQTVEPVIRTAATTMAFTWDLADPVFRLPTYAGFRRTMRAFFGAFRGAGVREFLRSAEREGAVMRDMDLGELHGTLRGAPGNLLRLASAPSRLTERFKAAWANATAHQMLKSWQDGTAPLQADRQLLTQGLRLSPEKVVRLLDGTAGKAVQDQFRHQFVQLLTNRTLPGESSVAHADRNLNTVVRYQRFFINRMRETAKAAAAALDFSHPDKAMRAEAMKRAVKLATALTLSGAVGTAIAYSLAELFRGNNPMDGARRLWTELSYTLEHKGKLAFAGEIGKLAGSQVVGGPVTQALRAATGDSETQAMALSNLAGFPGQVLAELGKLVTQSGPYAGNWMEDVWTLAKRIPLVPKPVPDTLGTAWSWLSPAAAAESEIRSGIREVAAWKREEGINERFARTKSDEFYAALREVTRAVRQHPDDPEQAMAMAEPALRQALGLESGDSLADSILASQVVNGLNLEQRGKLHDFVADERQMNQLYAYDAALREMAKLARKREGKNPLDGFDLRLEDATRSAAAGGADVWGPLVQDVVSGATQRLAAGDQIGDEIDRLAERMAAFPEQLGTVLGEAQFRSVSRGTQQRNARFIQAILRRRARDRANEREREARTNR